MKLKFNNIELLHSIVLIIVTLILSQFISVTFIGIVLLLSIWCLAISLKQVGKPDTGVGNVMAIFTASILFIDVGLHNVVEFFVGLLLLSVALKQLISIKPIHYKTITLIQLFLISNIFLYDQSLYISITAFLLIILSLSSLHQLTLANIKIKRSLKLSFKTLLLSLPIALIFFVLLPRLPSFWQMPGPGTAQTGLSENVDPFAISKLSKSYDLVFRADFKQTTVTPPYYWRAMIHENFKNQKWTISDHAKTTHQDEFTNNENGLKYDIIAEKSSLKWLYGLDHASSSTESIENMYGGVLARNKNLSQTIRYSVNSVKKRHNKLTLHERQQNLNLPINTNPEALNIAKDIYRQAKTDQAFFNMLLKYYNDMGFVYTLEPPSLYGDDKIDQFLSSTKRGFCGHYASASAFMFRSVGIPARVVSGYLGGEMSPDNQYMSIYQYDAHAWTEVWLPGKGWTIFDATSVVSPDRLLGSLSQSEQNKEEFLRNLNLSLLSLQDYEVFNWIRLNLNNIDFLWTSWVLGFDSGAQVDLLKSLFGKNTILHNTLVILLSIGVCLFLFYSYTKWQKLPKYHKPLEREYERLKRWGMNNQKPILAGMTPQLYCDYLANHFTKKRMYFSEFAKLIIAIRYQEKPFDKHSQRKAKQLIKHIIKKSKN